LQAAKIIAVFFLDAYKSTFAPYFSNSFTISM